MTTNLLIPTPSTIIVPPFTSETAIQKVRLAEDGWNSRDPSRVAMAYSEDSVWRNRSEFVVGRDQIRKFLASKWSRELEYRLVKALWASPTVQKPATVTVAHKTVKVGDLEIFYREAGSKDAPTLLLLHGFPTSSQMFRNLIPALADKYHVIAPDYPGFGHSSMPARDKFTYTFDNLARVIGGFTEKIGLKNYALYVQDYGAPVGYRLAVAHPERVTAIVVQNGNAYDEGIDNDFWKPIKEYWKDPKSDKKRDGLRGLLTYDATKWQYTHGVKNLDLISPDGPAHDQFLLDREGNKDIQLDLFLSYGSNPALYPGWQQYFRKHQPPMLIVWGKNDQIFPPPAPNRTSGI